MTVGYLKVVSKDEVAAGRTVGEVALFDADGNPVELGGGGESGPVAWADVTGKPATFPPTVGTTATTAKAGNYVPAWGEITGKPAVIAAGADAAAARAAIGAGTSNLALGTTASTAKAGNYVPVWGDVTGKPSEFTPAAHNQAASTITVAATGTLTGATAQLALEALAARVAALEAAAG